MSRHYLQTVNLKEQDLLVVLALGLVTMLLNLLVWVPLEASNRALRNDVQVQHADWRSMDGRLDALKAQAAVSAGEDMVTRVNGLVRQYGIRLDHFQPIDGGRANLSVNQADPALLLPWLQAMEQSDLILQNVSLSRAPAQGGLLNLRLTVAR